MFCKNCGTKMDESTNFCPSCGNEVSGDKVNGESNYTAPKPFETNSIDGSQNPQFQKSAFKGKQASTGTAGKIEFGGGKKKGLIRRFFSKLFKLTLFLVVLFVVYAVFIADTGPVYNIETATSIDNTTYEATATANRFTVNTPEIFVTFSTQDLEVGTDIFAAWVYTTKDMQITSAKLTTTLDAQNAYFSLSRPNDGWPIGNYEVQFKIGDEQVAVAAFTVAEE
jgi:hypothetical protein